MRSSLIMLIAATFPTMAVQANAEASRPLDLAKNASATPAYKVQQLRAYAEALLQISRIRRDLNTQLANMPGADRSVLTDAANAQIAQTLERHDLDVAQFNLMSAQVDSNRPLRREVRQFLMEDRIGF